MTRQTIKNIKISNTNTLKVTVSNLVHVSQMLLMSCKCP